MTLARKPPSPAEQPPPPQHQVMEQVGIAKDGSPIYSWPQQPAPAPQQPIQVRPWGAYIGGGCCAVIGLFFLTLIGILFVMGLAILATALTVCLTVAVICVLVLRGVWRDYQRNKG